MLRLFLTSSDFCTAMMTSYAGNTAGTGVQDILILDASRRSASSALQIKKTASGHQWCAVFDFSETVTDADKHLPGFRKQLTRRLKTLPLIRNAYRILHERYLKQLHNSLRKDLEARIREVTADREATLFLLKETRLNDSLHRIFPDATAHYFEHGLSDYMLMVQDPPRGKGKFFCVFADAFAGYLSRQKKDKRYVERFLPPGTFSENCREYFSRFPEQHAALQAVFPENDACALLLLQPFANIGVDSATCWPAFLDRCFSVSTETATQHLLIKPHPNQSSKEIRIVTDYLDRRGCRYTLLAGELAAMSIEVAFFAWKDKVRSVFTPYSSAVFYLSVLFSDNNCHYYYAFEFMRAWLKKTPAPVYAFFDSATPMIHDVFAEKCKPL